MRDKRTKATECKESVDHERVKSLNERNEQRHSTSEYVVSCGLRLLKKNSYKYGLERVGFERAKVEDSRGEADET